MDFKTYKEASEYVASREAEMGALKYRSTEEYRKLYLKLLKLHRNEGLSQNARRRRKKVPGFGMFRF